MLIKTTGFDRLIKIHAKLFICIFRYCRAGFTCFFLKSGVQYGSGSTMMFSKSQGMMTSVSSRYSFIYGECNFKRSFLSRLRSGTLACEKCFSFRTLSTEVALEEKIDSEKLSKEKTKRENKKRKALKKLSASNSESKSKSKSLSAWAQQVLNYVEEHTKIQTSSLTSLLPNKFLKSSSIIPTSVYLINKKEAENVSQLIKAEKPDLESPVLELHAGLGLLTSELLKEPGFKYVTCLEDNADLGDRLVNRFNISVIDCSLDDLPRHHHLDKHDGGERINSILSAITTEESQSDSSKRNTTDKKQLCLIGAIPHISTVNFLIRCYASRRVFFEDDLPWSGVTMFVALGSKAAHICNATPESGLVAYRPTSVFFQTFFKCKELGTIPRQDFIPWEVKETVELKGVSKKKLKVEYPDFLRLVRIEINEEVLDKIGKDNLFTFWYFIRQHLYARTSRVIPELERWIPGCGVKLIKQGFTIFTQFGTLNPDQLLDLYLQFTSWPEFANSSFLNAVEKFQTRLEITEEDDSNK